MFNSAKPWFKMQFQKRFLKDPPKIEYGIIKHHNTVIYKRRRKITKGTGRGSKIDSKVYGSIKRAMPQRRWKPFGTFSKRKLIYGVE